MMGNLQIPSFIKAHNMTYIIPATLSVQGRPNRGTTPEGDNQAIGMGKEDLEKLTRVDSCKHHSIQRATPMFLMEVGIST